MAGDRDQNRALMADYEEKNENLTREIAQKEGTLAALKGENERQNESISRLNQEKLDLEGQRVRWPPCEGYPGEPVAE